MDSATTNATNNNDNNHRRNYLSQDSRQKMVNKIMDTLQRHMPFTGPDELRKIALRFEEKIYTAAVDLKDYLRIISLKMVSIENCVSRDGNPLAGGSSSSNQKPLHAGPINELSQDSRQMMANKLMDTVQRHMPCTGPDGMQELRKTALHFEKKIYAAARDQQDYLRKISLKMLSLRTHVSRDGNPLAGGSSSSNQKPLHAGLTMPPQLRNPSHTLALVNGNGISVSGQSQPQQTLQQQIMKAAISGGEMQRLAGLPSTLPSMTNLSESKGGHVFGTQSTLDDSTGQVLSLNAVQFVQRHKQSIQQKLPQYHKQQLLQHQKQHFQHPQQQVLRKENLQQSQLAPPVLHNQQQSVMQKTQYQQAHQPSPSLLPQQSQHLQQQPQQQKLLSQLQQPLQQLQQQPLLPQSNSVQQELQQRVHIPVGLLQQRQQQTSVEQQKQSLQAQTRRQSDVTTTSMESSGQTGQSNVIDWQDKIYQKLNKGNGSMDSSTTNANNNNWRNELSQDSRHKTVNKIMGTLQRHMPFPSPDRMHELRRFVLCFEVKIYAAARDQQEYLHKISFLTTTLSNWVSGDGNPLAGGSSNSNQKPLEVGEDK